MRRIRALGGGAEDLLRVAAHLYSLQGRPELALAIYLRLHQPVRTSASNILTACYEVS